MAVTDDLPLALGRNLLSFTYESSLTERASRLAPVAQSLGGQPTLVGFARWRVTSPNSGAKTFVNEDPAGGAGAIGFDDQFVDAAAPWYILLERTGESFRITSTDVATQTFTLATWSAALLAGEMVQLRMSAPGTLLSAYSYRTSVPGVLPPPPGIPVYDAEVTALAGTVITVRDGWLSGGPQPVASDGQHVGRQVRLSTLVATDEITDFLAVDGEYWYTVADVSAYQVGDWIRRAANNAAGHYGDINTLITPAFPSGMTIVEIDSGANAMRVVSRDGGTSLNRVIYDNASFGSGYNDLRVYRPIADLHTVTDSDGTAHTLTLDSASGFSVGGGPGAVEILIASPSSSGQVPWYLEHPIYVQEPPTGIGVQFRTIDRSTMLGVENLVPNPVMRIWTTATSLPDGYLGAASLGAVGSATPSNFVIEQNTDPLYTRVGGKSLFVSVANGALYFPPIPWTPQFAGQRFSVRVSMLLTRWQQNSSLITLQLGIMQSDGTVVPWYDIPRLTHIQPLAVTSGVQRPDPPFRKFAANVWDDIRLENFPITDPSTYPGVASPRPTAGDIGNMGGGLGLVACLTFNAGGGTERIEGYIDGIVITPTAEAPADVKEFYDANRLHQLTNIDLRELGPPQFTIGVDFFDAKRMNPALDEPDAAKGVVADVDVPSIGIDHVRRRITDVWRNMNVPGDSRITLGRKRRRLGDAVVKPPTTKPPTSGTGSDPGGTTSGGTNGGTTPGGTGTGTETTPSIALTVSLDDTNTPTATASGDASVTRVKFAWRTDRAPTAEEVRAATSTTDFTSIAPFTLPPGQTAYAGALPYNASSVEGALASDSITAPNVSAVAPLVFLRRGVGLKTGDWGGGTNTEVEALGNAGNGDDVSAHLDASGNGLHHLAAINPNFLTYDDRFVPTRDGDEVRLGVGTFDGSTPIGRQYSFTEFSSLTEGEIWINARPMDATPSVDGTNLLWFLGSATTLFPKASDGHIYEGAARGSAADCGAVPGGVDLEALGTWYRVSIGPAGETNNYKVYLNGTLLHQETLGVVAFGGYTLGKGSGGYFDGRYGDYLIFDRVLSAGEAAAWAPYVSRATSTPPTEGPATPTLTYVRSGGDVIVTVTAPGNDSAKIAADLAATPSDATVRAADALTTAPYRATFAAPAAGETLHIGAFAYNGVTESTKLTIDIPFSAGDEGPSAPSGVEYVVTAADPSVPNARVLVDSATATVNTSTPGEVKIDVVGGAAVSGRWEPLTNGNPASPELVFLGGDVIMVFVPT